MNADELTMYSDNNMNIFQMGATDHLRQRKPNRLQFLFNSLMDLLNACCKNRHHITWRRLYGLKCEKMAFARPRLFISIDKKAP